jgi:micrococcal nuclease
MYTYKAKIEKVIDGDTVDVTIDLGFGIYHFIRLRLYGINTKEMHSKIEEERQMAIKAKEFVSTYLGKTLTIKTYKDDKYGRMLAEIFPDDMAVTINQHLLNETLAVEYYGRNT